MEKDVLDKVFNAVIYVDVVLRGCRIPADEVVHFTEVIQRFLVI